MKAGLECRQQVLSIREVASTLELTVRMWESETRVGEEGEEGVEDIEGEEGATCGA